MIRRLVLILLVCLLAGTIIPSAYGQGFAKLQHKFVAGETERYNVRLETKINTGTRSTAVTITGIREQQVTQLLPNGDAEIHYRFQDMKISSGKGWQDSPASAWPYLAMLVSPDGTVKEMRGLEKSGPAAQIPFLNIENLDQCLDLLPAIELRPGATWTQNITLPGTKDNPSTGSIKVEGQVLNTNESLKGIPVVRFGEKAEGKQSFSQPAPSGSPAKAKILDEVGTINAEVENCFSVETGRLVSSTGTGMVVLNDTFRDSDGKRVAGVNTGIRMVYQLSPAAR
jgi:hypothetical protein